MSIVKSKLSQVSSLIMQGVECWIKAGEIIAEELDRNEGHVDEICKATGLSSDIIRRFEQIGRKQLNPKLLTNTCAGYRLLSECSYSDQQRYSEEPIPILVVDKKGNVETLKVGVANLTSRQLRQAFGKGHVRDVAEQRAWLETEKARIEQRQAAEEMKVQKSPYVISGKRVIFRAGCELTASQLAEIIARIS